MTDLLRRLTDCIEQNERAAPNEPWLPLMREALAEIERAEKDAERYRWLRAQKHADIAACWFLPTEYPYSPSTAEEIDAAIDTALSASEEKP